MPVVDYLLAIVYLLWMWAFRYRQEVETLLPNSFKTTDHERMLSAPVDIGGSVGNAIPI